jgi:hypothetical protein
VLGLAELGDRQGFTIAHAQVHGAHAELFQIKEFLPKPRRRFLCQSLPAPNCRLK